MIEGKVFDILKDKIGDYFYDFDRRQFELSILNGTGFRLKCANMRPDKLNEILEEANAPMTVKALMIKNIKV